jgi:hypothetical protein
MCECCNLLVLERSYCTDLYSPYNREEGMDFNATLLHVNQGTFLVCYVGVLGSFLLLSVKLLFGTDFKVLKEGRDVQQYRFSGHVFQGRKLG